MLYQYNRRQIRFCTSLHKVINDIVWVFSVDVVIVDVGFLFLLMDEE